MPQENVAEIKQPNPFSESTWNTVPPTKQEPIVEEKKSDTPINEVKDPVIAEKDIKIKEEERENTKTEQPETVPAATPKDIPARPEEDKKNIIPATELKFANETSEKIFNLLKEGKEDDVYNFLNQKKTLSNIDKLPSADVIKLQIKNENKDYSEQEVQDFFNEKYSMPEKPVQGLETDDEFSEIENKYKDQVAKIERKIEREAKASKTELLKLQQELVLPDIPQKTPEPQEPTQEELAQFKKKEEQFLQAVDATFQKLDGYNATFKDEEVEIPVAYKIAIEEKEELKPLLNSLNSDLPQFFKQLNWIDKGGNLNTDKVVSDLHILQNKDKVIQKLVNEAGNKRRAEHIKSQKGVDFSGQQHRGNLDPSVSEEVDKKVRGFMAAT